MNSCVDAYMVWIRAVNKMNEVCALDSGCSVDEKVEAARALLAAENDPLMEQLQ